MKKIIILCFYLLASSIWAQNVTGIPEDVQESIEKRIKNGLTPSIAIGIIDENGPQYYMYGKRANNGTKVDEHTIYEIGSISKAFTGILLADASLKGYVSIDDPVENHLPDYVTIPSCSNKKITLGHLSDHTSALTRLPDNMSPSDLSNPYADYTVKQMYDFLSSHELRRDIGEEYEYSNLAQGLLGHTLALIEDKSYEELMVKVIADELGMSETKITLSKQMQKNMAQGHSNGMEVSNWDLPTLAGAGAIRSSVHDMLIFLAANLGLKDSNISKAMQLSHQQRHNKAGMGVGLGWHIKKGKEGAVIWHNGGTGGFRTFTGFVKETGKGVVVLTNSTDGSDDIGFRLLDSSSKLKTVKESAALILKSTIEKEGYEVAIKKYKKLEREKRADYNFSESMINKLGYEYLNKGALEEAMAIFKLNISSFPKSSNAYDSYAESLKAASVANYKKSLELYPGNTNAIDKLNEMGEDYKEEEITVSGEILQKYVGKYQLAPDFHIEITLEKSRLFAQATAQPRFELFPKNELEFYLKVVDAQIKFNVDKEGEAVSLALFQNGQVMPGPKVE